MTGKNVTNWSTDDLLKHLKEIHDTSEKEIADWMVDYLKNYPEMDLRQHLWHLHEVHHDSWEALTPHTHTLSIQSREHAKN